MADYDDMSGWLNKKCNHCPIAHVERGWLRFCHLCLLDAMKRKLKKMVYGWTCQTYIGDSGKHVFVFTIDDGTPADITGDGKTELAALAGAVRQMMIEKGGA